MCPVEISFQQGAGERRNREADLPGEQQRLPTGQEDVDSSGAIDDSTAELDTGVGKLFCLVDDEQQLRLDQFADHEVQLCRVGGVRAVPSCSAGKSDGSSYRTQKASCRVH